jgi:hypothetical protein
MPDGMSISWRGFYALTKLTFIHPNIIFYATSAPYLVERFQISNFVALQWFLCLRLQDSMRQTTPQESQNLYANRILISNFLVKDRWFSMLASMELYARAEL